MTTDRRFAAQGQREWKLGDGWPLPAAHPDPMTRIAEIRQENHGGDVSAKDIDWLLAVAEASVWLTKAPFGAIREHHFYKTREALNRDS